MAIRTIRLKRTTKSFSSSDLANEKINVGEMVFSEADDALVIGKDVSDDTALKDLKDPVKVIPMVPYAKKDAIIFHDGSSLVDANGTVYSASPDNTYPPTTSTSSVPTSNVVNQVYTLANNYKGTVTSVRVQANSPIESSTSTAQTTSLDTTISHATSGVTAGTYGSASVIPKITVDSYGHVTKVVTNTVSVTSATGTLPVSHGGTGNTSVDTAPTSGSTKMVTSGGVYTAINNLASTIGVFQAGTTAPTNTKLLWIDTTASSGGLKYYNGSNWVHVPVAFV